MEAESITAGHLRQGYGARGPVERLEAHVPREWWRGVFTELYLKTDGDVVENHANTRNDVDLVLGAIAANPNEPILDLCCGQGRHALELARRGRRDVTGIDQSSYLIALARARARQANGAVRFEEGDARRLPCPDAAFAAALLLGNSFGYFHDADDDRQVVREIRRALRPRGVFAIDISDGDWLRAHFEPRSWEWIDARLFVCRERQLSTDGSRLVCREIVSDVRAGVIADQFYALRLYSRPQLFDLLRGEGFADVIDRGLVETSSHRHQDLGLMARRMFVTAVRDPLR